MVDNVIMPMSEPHDIRLMSIYGQVRPGEGLCRHWCQASIRLNLHGQAPRYVEV